MLSLNCHTAKLTYSTKRCRIRNQDISFLLAYIDYSHAVQVFTPSFCFQVLGFCFFLLYIHKLLWKGLCPEALRELPGSITKIICNRLWGTILERVGGKPAVPAAWNIRPRKHTLCPSSDP